MQRHISFKNATELSATEIYKAYVGPADEYDLLGATQFHLLCTLGLRSDHRLLDVGCGSLRAGRFFIAYLEAERYFALEPNKWLVDKGVEEQVGHDLVNLKRPTFYDRDDFCLPNDAPLFDFILAQSIFSHTGPDLSIKLMHLITDSLRPDGLAAVTFYECAWPARSCEQPGWIYPYCVAYTPATIRRMASDAGLRSVRVPWRHPRQHWWLLSRAPATLPSVVHYLSLRGSTLFRRRAKWQHRAIALARREIIRRLSGDRPR